MLAAAASTRPVAALPASQALCSVQRIGSRPVAAPTAALPVRRAHRLLTVATAAPGNYGGYGPQGGECQGCGRRGLRALGARS